MRRIIALCLLIWLAGGTMACFGRPALTSTPTHQITPAMTARVALEDAPRYLAWSPDGQELAWLGTTQAHTLDTTTWQTRQRFTAAAVQTLAYTPAGRLLAFSAAAPLRLLDLSQEATLHTLPLDAGDFYTHLARFNPTADLLALPDNRNNISLWGVVDGTQRALLVEHDASPTALAWSPDGQRLASGDQSGNVYIWDWAAGTAVASHRRGGRAVVNLTYSPAGDLLAVSHANGELWLLDAASAGRLQGLEGAGWSLSQPAWTPDGAWLAAPGPTGPLLVWGVASGELLTVIDDGWQRNGTYPTLLTAFDPAGRRLAVGAAVATPQLTIWALSAP